MGAEFNPKRPIDARRAIQARGIIDRHQRAADAVAEGGGRSAPQAAGSRPMGLSADWGDMFPEAPTPQPHFSRPPLISARDAASMASPAPFMPTTDPRNPTTTIAAPIKEADGVVGQANLNQNMDMAANPRAFLTARPRAAAPATTPNVALDPRLPKATVTSTGITRDVPFNAADAHRQLYQTHRAVFTAGTPENLAFVEHAKKNGLESAFKNVATILPKSAIAAAAPPRPATPQFRQVAGGVIDPRTL